MELLTIESSEFTPKIILDSDKRILQFTGVSRPENVSEFYAGVVDWMAGYESELRKNKASGANLPDLHVIFKFSYFNSSSAKMIYTFLESIVRIKEMGYPLHIDWFFESGDDQMRDDGEELSEAIDIPFHFHETE